MLGPRGGMVAYIGWAWAAATHKTQGRGRYGRRGNSRGECPGADARWDRAAGGHVPAGEGRAVPDAVDADAVREGGARGVEGELSGAGGGGVSRGGAGCAGKVRLRGGVPALSHRRSG